MASHLTANPRVRWTPQTPTSSPRTTTAREWKEAWYELRKPSRPRTSRLLPELRQAALRRVHPQRRHGHILRALPGRARPCARPACGLRLLRAADRPAGPTCPAAPAERG